MNTAKKEHTLKQMGIIIGKKNIPNAYSIHINNKLILEPDFAQFKSENGLGDIINKFQFDAKLPGEVWYCECNHLGSLYAFTIKDLDGNVLWKIEKNYPNRATGDLHFYAVRAIIPALVEKNVNVDGSIAQTEKVELERVIIFDHDFENQRGEYE